MTAHSDATIRILVVDDHPLVRRGLSGFLDGGADLEVVGEAAEGRQALDELARLAAEARRPDVVLMDLRMQPVDGIEATRQIRARYDDVEVVALTSFVEEERVLAALDAGASGYILKDADPDEVAAAVRAAHRGELQLDAAVARRLMSSLPGRRPEDPAALLTDREREILRLVAAGKANKEIAAELVISERTARTHVSNILRKLGLASRTQAAVWAIREGLAVEPCERTSRNPREKGPGGSPSVTRSPYDLANGPADCRRRGRRTARGRPPAQARQRARRAARRRTRNRADPHVRLDVALGPLPRSSVGLVGGTLLLVDALRPRRFARTSTEANSPS